LAVGVVVVQLLTILRVLTGELVAPVVAQVAVVVGISLLVPTAQA
jgi:hypothetical protein